MSVIKKKLICKICTQSYYGHPLSKYCSNACRHIGKLQIMKKYNMSHFNQRKEYQIQFYKTHPHYCRDYDRLKRQKRIRSIK